jgi:hypothetical protein
VTELERKIGQQTLEIDFLKRVLQRVEEAPMLQALNGTASTRKSSKMLCAFQGVSDLQWSQCSRRSPRHTRTYSRLW